MNIRLLNNYSITFSDYINLKFRFNNYIPIIKNDIYGNKCIVFSEILINNFSKNYIKYLLLNTDLICKIYNINKILFYSFCKENIPYFNNNYRIYKINEFICDIEKWSVKSNVKNRLKKCIKLKELNIKNINTDKNSMLRAFKLRKFLKYNINNSYLDINKNANFYYYNSSKTIFLVIEINAEIISFMSGVIIKDTVYMLEHCYNSNLLNICISDYMYYNFIEFSKNNGIKKINFGTCLFDESGIRRMKKKYSTQICDKFVLEYILK